MEQLALPVRSRGWYVDTLPTLRLAELDRSNLKALGYETKPPEETKEGWAVKWRPRRKKVR